MRLRELIAARVEQGSLCPGQSTYDAWLHSRFARIPIAGRPVPLIPLWGLKRALIAHDSHHVLLGCDTSLRGEVQLAAWELASGGCGWNVVFWLDRMIALLLFGWFFPREVVRGVRQGVSHRNLYGMTAQQLLESSVDELQARVGVGGS